MAPYLVYEALYRHYGDTKALIASVLPPICWSLYELVKSRKLDALSIIVIASIALTVGATAMGGSARIIQIRDALVTGAIGVLFLLSLLMKRPLVFYLARAAFARQPSADTREAEALWAAPDTLRAFRVLTAIWGVGLVLQTLLLCILAWIWPIGRYLLLGSFIGYAVFGGLMLLSIWYGSKYKAILAGHRPDFRSVNVKVPEL